MTLVWATLVAAIIVLVVAAYLVIDRAKLPLLCLGVIASISGSLAMLLVVEWGLPAALAGVFAILVGVSLSASLVLPARFLPPMAFAALTLALGTLSLFVPIPTVDAGIVLGMSLAVSSLIIMAAALFLVRRFEISHAGVSLRYADHDSQFAASLGIARHVWRVPLLLISGGLAGLAGGLLAFCGAISAPSFGIELSLGLLAVIAISGRGSLWMALFVAIPVLLMPRLGVLTIAGFPDLTLAVSVLGVALTWILVDSGSRELLTSSAVE